MTTTKDRLTAVVPTDLYAAARTALDRPDATASEVVRAALAALAGLDPAEHAARRRGRPLGRRDSIPRRRPIRRGGEPLDTRRRTHVDTDTLGLTG